MAQGVSGGNVFDEMGQYWVEIADKDQTERQIGFLRRQLRPDGCFLDLACGSGRHTIALTKAGYVMVGLDVSLRLLKTAKQRGASLLVRGDMRFLPFKTAAFSAAISMDTSFGYLPSEEADAQSIAEVKRVLKRDGVFILDVFNRENLTAKYSGKPSVPKTREYPGFKLQQTRTVSNDGDQLCDTWTIRGKDGAVRIFGHSVRLYQRRQLEGLLSEAGFSVELVLGDYEGQQFSAQTPRLIILASAKT